MSNQELILSRISQRITTLQDNADNIANTCASIAEVLAASIISGNKLSLSPKTSNFTSYQPPISLASLSVLSASSELKQPAVLGK